MKLYQTISLLLCAVMLALGTACAGESAPAPDPSEEAVRVLELLANGEYEAVHSLLDDTVSAQLTPEAMEEAWLGQTGALGARGEIAQVIPDPQGERTVVQLVVEYEAGQLQCTFLFDADGRIAGLYFAGTGEVPEGTQVPLPTGATEREVLLFPGTGMELGGVIVLPEGADGSTPVVVMAHGSGSSDRDQTIGPNKPFRDIAYGLAQGGIASMRFDKLPYVHPELFLDNSYTADLEYTQPVLEALRVLREEADLGDAYLLGHSLGGMLTPYLIAQSEGGFAGGLILAGSPRPLYEISYDQNMAVVALMEEQPDQATLDWLDAELEKGRSLNERSEDELLAETVFGIPAYYLWHMDNMDTLGLVAENNVPLFIAQGGLDFQVTVEADLAAWQEGLAQLGSLVRFYTYDELNHLFMPVEATILDLTDAYNIPSTVDAGMILDMVQWIWEQDAGISDFTGGE